MPYFVVFKSYSLWAHLIDDNVIYPRLRYPYCLIDSQDSWIARSWNIRVLGCWKRLDIYLRRCDSTRSSINRLKKKYEKDPTHRFLSARDLRTFLSWSLWQTKFLRPPLIFVSITTIRRSTYAMQQLLERSNLAAICRVTPWCSYQPDRVVSSQKCVHSFLSNPEVQEFLGQKLIGKHSMS